ncbi:MAG TPA: Hpt domain-containing protein [Microlunatus sp.]
MAATMVFQTTTIDSLRSQLGDRGSEFVTGLIDLYLVQARDLVAQMESAGAASDLISLQAVAHKLKGSTATLGGERLAAACQRIETVPFVTLDVDDALREVRGEFEQLAAELVAYRSTLPGKPGSSEAV